jgi:hypothetical protein
MSIIVLTVGNFQVLILYGKHDWCISLRARRQHYPIPFFLIISQGAFSEFLFIGLSISAILYLRYKKPDRPRAFKVSASLEDHASLII